MAHSSPIIVTSLLIEGIAALRSGKRDHARTLLIAALTNTPNDATAWLWLSGAVTEQAEQRYCLERALTHDPTLVPAQHGLALLGEIVARMPGEFAEAPTDDRQPTTKDQSRTEQAQLVHRDEGLAREAQSRNNAISRQPSAVSRQPSALSRQSSTLSPPSLAIWTHPHAAMRTALNERNPWETGILGALAGINGVLAWAAQQNLGDQARPTEIIGWAVLFGPLLGLSGLVLGGVLLRSSGRWLGGRGGAGVVRAALAWASVPLIAGLLLWLLQLILLPTASFSAMPVGSAFTMLAVICGALQIALAIWAAWLSLVGLAVAHGFGMVRAALSWLLAGLLIAALAVTMAGGTAILIALRGG